MYNTINYSKYISKWISIFKTKLNENKNISMSFYILNKSFLDLNERRGQLNKHLLKENNDFDPEKKFYILEAKIWSSIKSNYPCEMEIKVQGKLNNKKCVLEFDKHLCYFYFLNANNIIEEGYMKFENQENADLIIKKFFDLEINAFFQETKILNQMNIMQKIFYQNQDKNFSFSFKLKEDKDLMSNNKAFIMNSNEIKENCFNLGYNNNFNNIKNVNNYKKIYNNYNKNNNIACKIENCKLFPIRDEKSYESSLKIYRCIYYYYEFKQNFKNINEIHTDDIFLQALTERSLQILSPLINNWTYLPITNYSAGPIFYTHICNDIIINQRKYIVELGSGVSTILLARLIRKNRLNTRIISVDHDTS